MTLWSSVSKSRLSTFKQSLREGSTVISSTTSLKRSLYNGSNSLAHNLRARATTHRRVTKLWACRQPTQKEVETLLHLKKLLRTQYSEQSHGRLLRRLWNATHPGGVSVSGYAAGFYCVLKVTRWLFETLPSLRDRHRDVSQKLFRIPL